MPLGTRLVVKGFRFVGFAWIAAGIVMFLFAKPRLVIGAQSRDWPNVTGQIIMSRIVPARNSNGRRAAWKVRIIYAYSPPSHGLDTDRLYNDRISTHGFADPADDSYTLAQARQLAGRFPVDKAVTVYYNPNHPQQSVLQPGTTPGTFGGSVMGLVSALLGILLLRLTARWT